MVAMFILEGFLRGRELLLLSLLCSKFYDEFNFPSFDAFYSEYFLRDTERIIGNCHYLTRFSEQRNRPRIDWKY